MGCVVRLGLIQGHFPKPNDLNDESNEERCVAKVFPNPRTFSKLRVKWENQTVKNGEPCQQGRSWPPNLTLVFSEVIFVPIVTDTCASHASRPTQLRLSLLARVRQSHTHPFRERDGSVSCFFSLRETCHYHCQPLLLLLLRVALLPLSTFIVVVALHCATTNITDVTLDYATANLCCSHIC
ncbi:hypothetical protein VNO78_06793 [Psophocarpus tetragonolobus]|uniref:Uncharacterized protein n=1 Tax=Psophocarpus tetragonolobus TaxID=3891 RepID=A0AAN9SSG2_PSOTE